MDYIFIHGAPGTGKSSLAWALQTKLQSPCFEFGWIPEFRVKKNSTISYEEEEQLAFENLTLVVKNYIRHGFENVIITDLRDPIVYQIPSSFTDSSYILITLFTNDDKLLKSRVLNTSRSSDYRDWESAINLNHRIIQRPLMSNEVRLNSSLNSTDELSCEVLKIIESPEAQHN